MTQMIQRNAIDDNYIYFLDQTSRLYYGTITQAAYRSSIDGFFLGGSTNIAIDCILSKLAAEPVARRCHAPPSRSVRSRISSMAAVAPQM